MPLVVSVTVTFVKRTVIGGLHGGWNVAVRVSENSAFPFCTGKVPSFETDSSPFWLSLPVLVRARASGARPIPRQEL
jgi:hypothetical protein